MGLPDVNSPLTSFTVGTEIGHAAISRTVRTDPFLDGYCVRLRDRCRHTSDAWVARSTTFSAKQRRRSDHGRICSPRAARILCCCSRRRRCPAAEAAEYADSVPLTRVAVASARRCCCQNARSSGRSIHRDRAGSGTGAGRDGCVRHNRSGGSRRTDRCFAHRGVRTLHGCCRRSGPDNGGRAGKEAASAYRARQQALPTTTCYKWRLISQHSKAPRAATIDWRNCALRPACVRLPRTGTFN